MMNEAESIELLSKSSEAMRTGILGSLSSKQDRRVEQGRWKETKAEEKALFAKNIEHNKECIDEVVQMYRLKSQLEPSLESTKRRQQDLSSMWSAHLAKTKEAEGGGGGGGGGEQSC
jgi:hypothetical protein